MHYLAGMFDAEGWISLTPLGHCIIGVEIAHKPTVEMFLKHFGGKIYTPTRKSKKQVYSWRIPSNHEQLKHFIKVIAPLCKLKHKALFLLDEYLDQPRIKKRETRKLYCSQIAALKKPPIYKKEQLVFEPTNQPNQDFFKWLAGFIDGDGYFGVFEYQNYSKKSFDSSIAAFNTHAEAIEYIQHHIKGSINCGNKNGKNPVWRWVCNQESSLFTCKSLEPYLIIKKEQCRLVAHYLAIHMTKKPRVDYSDSTIAEIRNIIKQIKHHNSF
jgi:hypothetical protein